MGSIVREIETNKDWKFALPIREFYKKKGQKEGEEVHVLRGLASGVEIDRDHERMAESAILAMQRSIEKGVTDAWTKEHTHVPLRNEHSGHWNDVLGYIVKSEVDEHHNLWIEAELDMDNPSSVHLWKSLSKGKQLGLSVGGSVLKVGQEWADDLKKHILVYLDVGVNEASVTSAPAYAPSLLAPLAKSITKDGTNWKDLILEDDIMKKTIESTEQAKADAAVETVAKTGEETAAEEQVEKSESANADPDKTDAAEDTVEKSEGTETEAQPNTDQVVKSSSEAVDQAAGAIAKEIMDKISDMAADYRMAMYQLEYLSEALVQRSIVDKDDMVKALARKERGDTSLEKNVGDKNTVEGAETPAVEDKSTTEAVVEKTATESTTESKTEVATDSDGIANIVKNAVAEAIKDLAKTNADLVERIDALESTPIDKSLSVAKQKVEEEEDFSERFRKDTEKDDPKTMLRKGMTMAGLLENGRN